MKARNVIEASPALPATPPAKVRQAPVLDQRQMDVLAACLVGEAGGEGPRGMQAVMNVIVNRSGNDYLKFSAVALRPKQFSMFNKATGSKPTKTVAQIIDQYRNHPLWAQAHLYVRDAVAGTLPDVTVNAKFYHAQRVAPKWANPKNRTAQVGNHVFYKESVAERLLRQLL